MEVVLTPKWFFSSFHLISIGQSECQFILLKPPQFTENYPACIFAPKKQYTWQQKVP